MLHVNTLPVGAGQANCYIISNEDEALIIDPGADAETINEEIDNPTCVLLLSY